MGLIGRYMASMAAYGLLGGAVCAVVRGSHWKRRGEPPDRKREVLLLLLAAYCVGLASQSILPRWYTGVASETGKFFVQVVLARPEGRTVNLVPFRTIADQLAGNMAVGQADVLAVAVLNLVGNLVVFSPIGFFLPLLWEKFRSWKTVLPTALLIGGGVEFIQYFIGRSPDIDDVILNTLSILLGFWVWRLQLTLRWRT